MFNFLRTATLCLVCLLSIHGTADEKSAAAEFQGLLANMQVYTAQFSQTVFDDLGEELQTSSGYTQVQRPGKLYWHSSEPFSAITVSNNSVLWHYDVDLEQVTRSTLSEDMSETPALILGGDISALEEGFTIARIASQDSAYALTPKSEGGLFTTIEFHFTEDKLLSGMTILDSLQQKTEIVFEGASINGKIDESLFDFVLPEGVDLIDNDD